ncbi:aldehyde dehydrogenase family protein [Ammoniphilus sp. 3BR4]
MKLEPEQWDNGFYIQPTVVIGPDPGHEIVVNEQFGPVVPLVSYRTEEEVIHLANQTEYGLGSTVWTSDEERGWRVARQLEAGLTGINGKIDSPLGFHIVPFGGVKQSGMGYERGKADWKSLLSTMASRFIKKVTKQDRLAVSSYHGGMAFRTISTNPMLYTVGIILLAMGTAAYAWGVDRYMIPWLKANFNKTGNREHKMTT